MYWYERFLTSCIEEFQCSCSILRAYSVNRGSIIPSAFLPESPLLYVRICSMQQYSSQNPYHYFPIHPDKIYYIMGFELSFVTIAIVFNIQILQLRAQAHILQLRIQNGSCINIRPGPAKQTASSWSPFYPFCFAPVRTNFVFYIFIYLFIFSFCTFFFYSFSFSYFM